MSLLAPLYARGAAWRRSWYARHPEARRSLARPVISVGNLSVGGSGKTPVVAALARLLLDEGERPSILTRGYARKRAADGVVVVSDRDRVREAVARSGDEPQMLARQLPGVPVLASADRFLAGRLAERQFDCTVHLLDDGFQHLQLQRDLDLVLVSPDDLAGDVLPAGRLRESLDAAKAADALLVTGGEDPHRIATRLGVECAFSTRVVPGAPRRLEPFGAPLPIDAAGRRVVAVAAIARPERFFATVREQGWDVVEEIRFRDHHWFDARDLARIAAAAEAGGADLVLTTEKDAVRLECEPLPAGIGIGYVPVQAVVEPEEEFKALVRDRT